MGPEETRGEGKERELGVVDLNGWKGQVLPQITCNMNCGSLVVEAGSFPVDKKDRLRK